MATFLPTLLAIIILASGLWIGLPGIWAGGRVCQLRGPDHLMHYPVGVPWFRGKVNSAKWVVQTGRLFAGGALLSTALILTAAWWPAEGVKPVSPCVQMTPLDALARVAGQPLEYGRLVDNGHRCEVTVRTEADQQTVLRVEIDAPQALIGASLESQRLELVRRSMKITPAPPLGSDAVLATEPGQSDTEVVILFTWAESTVRAQLPATQQDQASTWIRALALARETGR